MPCKQGWGHYRQCHYITIIIMQMHSLSLPLPLRHFLFHYHYHYMTFIIITMIITIKHVHPYIVLNNKLQSLQSLIIIKNNQASKIHVFIISNIQFIITCIYIKPLLISKYSLNILVYTAVGKLLHMDSGKCTTPSHEKHFALITTPVLIKTTYNCDCSLLTL